MSAVLNIESDQGLTRTDITSLKQADSVVFRTHETMSSVIEATKKDDKAFAGSVEHRVKVAGRHTMYRGAFRSACCVMLCAQYVPQWQTLVRHVFKAGDHLTLSWVGGNTSPRMQEANMWLDALNIEVRRVTRAGKSHVLAFALETKATFRDSPRMIETQPQ